MTLSALPQSNSSSILQSIPSNKVRSIQFQKTEALGSLFSLIPCARLPSLTIIISETWQTALVPCGQWQLIVSVKSHEPPKWKSEIPHTADVSVCVYLFLTLKIQWVRSKQEENAAFSSNYQESESSSAGSNRFHCLFMPSKVPSVFSLESAGLCLCTVGYSHVLASVAYVFIHSW